VKWQLAQVVGNERESARTHRLTLDVPEWGGHLPGQHLDVRLTAEDGYTAQRSYSIASPPEQPYVDLIVERLPDGEVSPYLTEEVRAGDRLELRGPIGGYFVWRSGVDDAPVQLIAGGAGVAPFLAMIAHHEQSAASAPMRLLYSTRTAADVIGAKLLPTVGGVEVTITLTGTIPPGWAGATGRVNHMLLSDRVFPPDRRARIYVCGSTSFVEFVAVTLLELGHDAAAIRTERFGATGGAA
jgi:ferredoxin-NADP reductase